MSKFKPELTVKSIAEAAIRDSDCGLIVDCKFALTEPMIKQFFVDASISPLLILGDSCKIINAVWLIAKADYLADEIFFKFGYNRFSEFFENNIEKIIDRILVRARKPRHKIVITDATVLGSAFSGLGNESILGDHDLIDITGFDPEFDSRTPFENYLFQNDPFFTQFQSNDSSVTHDSSI